MKEGLSVGLVVGMSGGGEGMLGGLLGLLNVTRTPSFILWTSWLGAGWRTEGDMRKEKENLTCLIINILVLNIHQGSKYQNP